MIPPAGAHFQGYGLSSPLGLGARALKVLLLELSSAKESSTSKVTTPSLGMACIQGMVNGGSTQRGISLPQFGPSLEGHLSSRSPLGIS
jgi:hypothetical protein